MLNLTTQAIDKWYEENAKKNAYNIRASDLGDNYGRRIWYKNNGAPLEEFSGRMLRLFDRGHREEERFVEALKGIGVTIWGDQKPLMAFGREFGHIDGMGIGFPEAPKTVHLLEYKTYNDKGFKKSKTPKESLLEIPHPETTSLFPNVIQFPLAIMESTFVTLR